MQHPYQCLLYCPQPDRAEGDILVTASGPLLHTFSVEDGTYLSTWPASTEIKPFREESESFVAPASHESSAERPPKRRRLTPPRDDSGSSAEIVVDDGDGILSGTQIKQILNPPFIKLAAPSTGQNVVAATGDDKCIRVFALAVDGTLTQLSERLMPKRPCALVLTPDDSTILCADKFGDVYSLPLLGQTYESTMIGSGDKAVAKNGSKRLEPNKFVPAATSLTVHTKGNREALRQQQKITNARAEKKTLNFDHQLLLGHVSLLTDVICTSTISSSGKKRDYILTSDRDEHIRVSRGIPQTHIVEGYCLGHTEFVSKMCVPPDFPRLLVSGGGDSYLLLWDWHAGKILHRVDLKSPLQNLKLLYQNNIASGKPTSEHLNGDVSTDEDEAAGKLAVSNIIFRQKFLSNPKETKCDIIVTCEGVPALFILSLSPDATIIYETSIPLEGNVLDLVCFSKQGSIIYSMDHVHKPFSTNVIADDNQNRVDRHVIGAVQYNLETSSYEKTDSTVNGPLVIAMEHVHQSQTSVPHDSRSVAKGRSTKDLLYGLESLRKRGTEEHEDIDD